MPLKTDGRGAWLEGGQTAALNAIKKQMAVVAGCQEVQGACLEGCLGKACGGFGGFGGFEGFEGFGGFEGGQTAALNALKNRWPWAGKRQPRMPSKTDGRGAWLEGGQTAALRV